MRCPLQNSRSGLLGCTETNCSLRHACSLPCRLGWRGLAKGRDKAAQTAAHVPCIAAKCFGIALR